MDKKYLLRIISYVALALAALVLIADIAFQIGNTVVQEVETVATNLIETSESIYAEGYIVRTEAVLSAQTGGFLGYAVENGERVSQGDAVANVYADTADNRSMFSEISRIDHWLTLLSKANAVKGIYTIASADQRIAALRLQLDEKIAQGTPGNEALEDELLMMLYVRDLKSGKKLEDISSRMQQERSALQEQLGSASQTVTADRIGYFYSSCDGYESFMDGETVLSATISELEELLHRQKEPEQESTAVGKIVTDYNWYLVCELPNTSVRGMTQSKSYTVHFSGDNELALSMKLARMVYEYGNENSVLIFQCSEMPEGFEYIRYQPVTIDLETFNGYRVPVSAVRNLNGICGVYVLRGSIVDFREISPVSIQDGVVVVAADAEATGDYKMLQYYDQIIVRGKDLHVGKIID